MSSKHTLNSKTPFIWRIDICHLSLFLQLSFFFKRLCADAGVNQNKKWYRLGSIQMLHQEIKRKLELCFCGMEICYFDISSWNQPNNTRTPSQGDLTYDTNRNNSQNSNHDLYMMIQETDRCHPIISSNLPLLLQIIYFYLSFFSVYNKRLLQPNMPIAFLVEFSRKLFNY